MQLKHLPRVTITDTVFPCALPGHQVPADPSNSSTPVPSEVSTVALITYQSVGDILDASFFNDPRGRRAVRLNSRVVSGTVGLRDKLSLAAPVSLTFQHTQVSAAQRCPQGDGGPSASPPGLSLTVRAQR